MRAAVWTSFTRPSFKQARAYAIFDSDIELCPPGSDDCDDSQGGASLQQLSQYVLGSDNALDVGNPNLLAMTSVNYDASIGWYPDEDRSLQSGWARAKARNIGTCSVSQYLTSSPDTCLLNPYPFPSMNLTSRWLEHITSASLIPLGVWQSRFSSTE